MGVLKNPNDVSGATNAKASVDELLVDLDSYVANDSIDEVEDAPEDYKDNKEAGEPVGSTVTPHVLDPAGTIPTAASAETDEDASDSIQEKIK